MKRISIGILLGVIAGIIDLVPMIVRKLPPEADISAFLMWIVVGFLVTITDLKINPVFKGIVIALLVLLPSAILIGWNDLMALIPISLMTILLGGLVGYATNEFDKNSNKQN
jgi:hypothetical protein